MSIFGFAETYEEAWKSIIMPPRQEYTTTHLGAPIFMAKNSRVQRLDFQLHSKKGHLLECSFYQHVNMDQPYPCIVFLHGNGCSRLEALQYVNLVLGHPVSFFTFDFSGCGRSGGRYSSMGWYEQDDLECVLEYLYNTRKVSRICLWGRSMGATTALLYASKHPEIEYLILDSAFASFKKLIKEMAQKKTVLPGFLASSAFSAIRNTILEKACFDIDNLRPIDCIHKVKATALFGAGRNDDFVAPQHTTELYEAYRGPKNIELFNADHNSSRPIEWLTAIMNYIKIHILVSRRDQQTKLTGLDSKSFRDVVTNPGQNVIPSPIRFETSDMKFTWLDANSNPAPSNPFQNNHSPTRSLSCKKGNEKPTVGYKIVDETRTNKNVSNELPRQRGNTTSAVPSRLNEETNTSPKKNQISQVSARIQTIVNELEIERTVTPQKVWHHENYKTTLGPKLATLDPNITKEKEGKGHFALRKSFTTKEGNINENASLDLRDQYKTNVPLDPYNLISTFNKQGNQGQKATEQGIKEIATSRVYYPHPSSPKNDLIIHSNMAAPIGFAFPDSPKRIVSAQKAPGHKKRNNFSVSFASEQFKISDLERDSPRKKASVERENYDTHGTHGKRTNNFSPQNKKIQIRIDPASPIFNPIRNAMPLPYNNYLKPCYVNQSKDYNLQEDSQQSSFINPTMISQTTSAFSSFIGNYGTEYLSSHEDKAKVQLTSEESSTYRRLSTGTTQTSLASK